MNHPDKQYSNGVCKSCYWFNKATKKCKKEIPFILSCSFYIDEKEAPNGLN